VSAIAFTIMMSWGLYFDAFNSILYHLLPLYNKFRAPSMVLVIPQLLLPLMAVLTVNKVAELESKREFLPYFKKGLIAVAAVFVVMLFCYMSFDFLNSSDETILKQVNGMNQPQLTEAVRSFFDALKDDRRSLMLGDILRSLGFCLAGLAILYFMVRKAIKPVMAAGLLAVVVLIDLLPVDSLYLNSESFVEPDENTSVFIKTPADEAILADKSYYRVFNVSGDAFSENLTSYHYNSIGGYHPAKLRIYQDLIEKQLSKPEPNMPVLNMLNVKYFIQKNQQRQTQNYQKNDSALGPVWFVKTARFVKDANEEMAAIDHFNPADTAILQESFRKDIGNATNWDASGTISLVKNDNDIIEYKSSSTTPQLAVFSEIYYPAGWEAFIDDKQVNIAKANYVLRTLAVPAGDHKIVFKFEPADYLLGRTLTTVFTILLLLLVAAGIFLEWRRQKQTTVTV
jgi:hypothetical protein